MLIADILRASGASVVVDSRAEVRDSGAPSSVTVEMVTGSVAEAITRASAEEPPPFAVVTEGARVFIVSTGGTGVVQVIGSGRPNPAQDALIAQIRSAATEVWPGVKLVADGNLGTSQGKPRKKAAAKKSAPLKVVETPVTDTDDDDVPDEPDWRRWLDDHRGDSD